MSLHSTRGAASILGFGFAANTGGPDWSKYAMIPFNTTVSQNSNQVAFLNVPANTYDYTVSLYSGSKYLIRMGNYLLIGSQNGYYEIKDIRTNATTRSLGASIAGGSTFDFFKFAEDKFGVLTKDAEYLQVATFKVNVNGTVTQIAFNSGVTTFASQTGFNSPQGAAIVTCDSKAMFQSFSGKVAFSSIYSYSGPTVTAYGNINVSQDGTSISLFNSTTNQDNFSRPTACSGGLGAAIIYNMDRSSYYLSTGSEYSISGLIGGDGTAGTNFRGCGITLSQAFLTVTYDYVNTALIKRIASGYNAETIATLSVSADSPSFAMQMYGNGAFIAYNTASNVPVYRTYSSQTNTVSGETTIPFGANYGINRSSGISGIYNY